VAVEFLHVAGGAAWTSSTCSSASARTDHGAMPIPARIQFTTRLMPKMVVIMPVVVTLTLAAGWQLSTLLGTNLTVHRTNGWVGRQHDRGGVDVRIALGLLERRTSPS